MRVLDHALRRLARLRVRAGMARRLRHRRVRAPRDIIRLRDVTILKVLGRENSFIPFIIRISGEEFNYYVVIT